MYKWIDCLKNRPRCWGGGWDYEPHRTLFTTTSPLAQMSCSICAISAQGSAIQKRHQLGSRVTFSPPFISARKVVICANLFPKFVCTHSPDGLVYPDMEPGVAMATPA